MDIDDENRVPGSATHGWRGEFRIGRGINMYWESQSEKVIENRGRVKLNQNNASNCDFSFFYMVALAIF